MKSALRVTMLVGVASLLIALVGVGVGKDAATISLFDRAATKGLATSAAQSGHAEPATGERIQFQIISMDSIVGFSTNYRLGGATGQTAVGTGSSTNYGVDQGFWSCLESGCCVGLAGNVDASPDEIVDIGDLTALIDYLFITFTVPECMEEANVDGRPDGIVDIGDLAALIDYLFISFTPPAACL